MRFQHLKILIGIFLASILLSFSSEEANAQATVTIVKKNSCGASDNGTFTITVTAGVAPFTLNLFGINEGTSILGQLLILNTPFTTPPLPDDDYFIIVNDGDGANPNFFSNQTIAITPPITAILSTPVNNSDPTCAAPNGSITINTVTGGSGFYNFLWTGPSINVGNQANQNQVNLQGGSYAVVLTDQNGNCTFSPAPIVLTDPLPTPFTISGAASICSGANENVIISNTDNNVVYSVMEGVTVLATYTEVGAGSTNVPVAVSGLAVGAHTLRVRASLIGSSCTPIFNTAPDLNVTVIPLPTAVISGGVTICAGQSTNLTFTLTGTGPWTINYNDGSPQSTAAATSPHTISVSPALTTIYTIVDVVDATTCVGAGGSTTTVTVNPVATVDAGLNKNSCINAAISLTGATIGGSASTGAWSIFSGPGGGILSTTSQTAAPATVTFTGTATGVYILELLTDDPAGPCPAVSDQVSVTVNALPTAAISGGTTICEGQSTNLTFTLTGASPWTINYNDGSPQSTVAAASPHTISASPAATTIYTIVGVVDANTCVGAGGSTTTVIVNPAAMVDAGLNKNSCINSAIPLTGATIGGSATSGAWSIFSGPGGGILSTTSQTATPATVTFTGTATGAYILELLTDDPAGPCPAVSDQISITVSPLPTAVISGGVTICAGQSTNLTFTLTGTGPWTINYNDGSPQSTVAVASPHTLSVSPASTTVYTIVDVVDANTCVGAGGSTTTVTVNPAATVDAGLNKNSCINSAISLTGATIGGSATTGAWSIFSGPGGGILSTTSQTATPATVTFTGTVAGVYVLELLTDDPAGPCPAVSDQVSVTVSPLPTVAISGGVSICAGQSTNLTFTLTGTGPWTINYNDGSPQSTVAAASPHTLSVSPAATTVYTIVDVVDATTCVGAGGSTTTVTVNPLATPALAGPASVCINGSGTYTTDPAMTNYVWIISAGGTISSGGTSTDNTVDVDWTVGGPQTVAVSYDDGSSCTSIITTLNVNVVDLIVTTNTVTDNTFCVGFNGSISLNVSGQTGSVSYSWTSGSGTRGNIANPTDLEPDDWDVTVTDDVSGCSVTLTTITVNDNPASLNISAANISDNFNCVGPNGAIDITVTGAFGTLTYAWTSPTFPAFNQSTQDITGLQDGDYDVLITDQTTGCTFSTSGSPFTVGDQKPVITLTPNAVVDNTQCVGPFNGSIDLDVAPAAASGTYTYSWTDGATFSAITEDISNLPAANYTVIVTDVASGCTATTMIAVADALTSITADISGTATICAGDATTLTFNVAGLGATFDVVFTDGTTPVTLSGIIDGATTNVSPTSDESYTIVSVTDLTSGCIVSSPNVNITGQADITVNPLPTTIGSGGGSVCAGGTLPDITFTFTGLAPFDFTYSDGTTPVSVIGHPSTTFTFTPPTDGTYQVISLTDDNGCNATSFGTGVSVSTTPLPTAVISGGVTLCAGQSTNLTFTLTGTGPWTINYSDGSPQSTVAATSPHAVSVTPAITTVYTIVDITDATTCVGLGGSTTTVTVNPTATIDAGLNKNSCINSAISLTGATIGGSATTGAWSIFSGPGGGILSTTSQTATPATVTFTGTLAGVYVLELLTDDPAGPCSAVSDQVSVTVSPVPSGVLSGSTSICVGQSATLTVNLTGAGPWDIGYSDGSVVTNINAIAVSPHTFTVSPFISTTYSLVSVSNTICGAGTASGTAAVTVNPIPGDQVTLGTDTWIGYVYNDSGSPAPPVSNINFSNAKYRGFIDQTDISTLGVSTYNVATDAFNLNLSSTFPLNGPNVCGSYLDDFSIRFRMKKTFAQGVYTFTVGGDDGVRLYIDGVLMTLSPANSFNTHAFTTYTTNVQCITAGQHDFVIEYFERGGFARVSFAYQAAVAPTVTTPVSLCTNSAIPTLTANSVDPAVTGYAWYTDASLTNQVAATQNYTPLSADLDMTVAALSDFYVTAVYACGQSLAAQLNVDVVSSAIINVPAPPVQICQTGGIVDLTTIVTATPAGTLTFSGTGITTNPNFDPTLVTGTSAITVTYAGGCAAPPVTFNIDVVPNSAITVPASTVSVCQAAGVQDLTLLVSASPAGGTFTFAGSGVTGSSFDPAALTGAVAVTVDYNIGGSCAATQQTINFDVVTVATLTVDNSQTVCPGSGTVDLSTLIAAIPAGGSFTFSGATGISGNLFDPSTHAGSAVVINVAYNQGGCTSASTVTVTVRAASDPLCVGGGGGCSVPVISKVDASCTGISNGSISITSVSGGVGPYTYSIDNGSIFQAASAFPNLAAGNYSVLVKDALACLSSVNTIVILNTINITGSILKTDESCAGGDGSIQVTNPLGGSAPYQYSKDNGVTFQLTDTFSNLGTGAYFIVIKDNAGCMSAPISTSVVQPSNCNPGTGTCATVVIVPKPSPATCTNSNGKIVFSIKPFVPLINNTGVKIDIKGISATNLAIARTNFNDSTFLNLPLGTYDYTIEYGDAACIKTGQVTIDQSGTIGTPVVSNIVKPICFGQATGSVTLDVPGETGNLLEWSLDGVVWTQFTAGSVITGVPAGIAPLFDRVISVRRNSSDPCNASVNVIIQEANPVITATITAANASCSNNDGSLVISNIGGGSGVANFTYKLNGVSIPLPSDNTFKGLGSGSFVFSIVDNVGCQKDFPAVDVKFPGFVNHTTPVATAPDCTGAGNNGIITFQITDIGAFQVGYTTDAIIEPTNYFNPGGAAITISGLSNGNYYIWIKSSGAQCATKLSPVSISGVFPVSFISSATNVLCFGATAEISLTSIKGAPNLDYTYEVIKDGVTTSGLVTFTQSLGEIKIPNLAPGNYQVRLTQNQSSVVATCTAPIAAAYQDISILGATKPLDTLYVNKVISLPDQATGSILIGIKESEQEPYEVRLELMQPLFPSQAFVQDWTQAIRNPQNLKVELDIDNLFAGNYQLSLRDALGCVKTYAIALNVDTNIYIPNVFTPNGDGVNDVFFIRNLPSDANLLITNRWGKEVFTSGNYQNDWGAGEIADGIYYYKLNVLDESITGWVEIMRGK